MAFWRCDSFESITVIEGRRFEYSGAWGRPCASRRCAKSPISSQHGCMGSS